MRKKFFFLGILLGVCLASPAQFYSARTNLIGLATGNINLEGVQGKRRFLPPYFVGLQQIN
nr:MAG: hypothetical protein [Bacteriophage sp.]